MRIADRHATRIPDTITGGGRASDPFVDADRTEARA
jgi:hypothetical protein